ncbi:DNA recombination/repair protein RecA [bacterium]|nr:DNA recombination/repair protein RecA [bacterium]
MSKKNTKENVGTSEFMSKFLKSNKDYHYNFEETAESYVVSTGSLILDRFIGGGLGAGLQRFVGCNEGGKTNEALQVMKNMLETVGETKGLYIKAEGRLSSDIQKRSGLNFVSHPDDWDLGTCLVWECNIYDTVFDGLRQLLKNNPDKEKFCIVIDSMDGLISKGDLEKTTSDANKVAAGASLTSDFLKRVSLGMGKFGHMCIMISQVRSTIKTNQYAASDPNNQTNSSGGNAALHYPDWIINFEKRNQADLILQDPKARPSPENPIIGHYAKVHIQKSTNESTGMRIRYPIKHGRLDGKSIWVEREIIEMLLMWNYIEKSASWFKFDSELINYLADRNIEVQEKYQGMKSLYDLLESNEELTKAIHLFIAENIFS